MIIGLVVTGVFCLLPLIFVGTAAFIVLRAAAGLATAMYDPAARGYLTDAIPPERRGEAFGLYGAVQMGGFLVGPAIGAIGAQRFGGVAFVFVFSGVVAVLAAIPIALRLREVGGHTHPSSPRAATEFSRDAPAEGRAAARLVRDSATAGAGTPRSLWNRGLIAALVINAGGNFAGGTYEVIWSLFLTSLGASLDLVGLTFAMFGLPVLLLSPYAGRLVDRRGSLLFIVVGSILPAAMGLIYPRIPDPLWAVPLILVEATGFAMLNPALYSVVAANSPPGRSSTAQGLFGAAGTVGFIVASLIAGVLAKTNIVYPMYVFTAVLTTTLIVGLFIGRGRLDGRSSPAGSGSHDGSVLASAVD
jgi:MFS family permease